MIASGTIEYAAASGRFWAWLTWITLPMNWTFETTPGHDVVAQGQAEGEDRARHHGREGQRQDDPSEGRPDATAEVGGRLQERSGIRSRPA